MPLPAEQLMDLLQRQYMERLNDARESLRSFNTEPDPGHLWNIVGYENLIHKAREMIGKAKESIFVSLWEREAKILMPDFLAAQERGIDLIVFSFTPIPIKADRVFTYNIPEKELKTIWDRKIILVIDKNELVMGEADDKYTKKTAWTDNKAIVDIATNHMILDITLFGFRKHQDVGDTVISMETSGFQNLEVMLDTHDEDQLQLLKTNV